MAVESGIDPCATLQEEIRQLEAQLAELDSSLGPQLVEVPDLASEIPFRKVEFRNDDLSSGDESETAQFRWIGLLVLAASVAGLWLIVIAPMLRGDQSSRNLEDKSLPRRELERDLAMGEEALRSFYRADSINEILRWVRSPETLEPVIHAHYLRKPLNPCEIEIDQPQRAHFGDEKFVLAVVRLPHLPEGRDVAVAIGETGARVDWELAMNSQRKPWRNFSATSLSSVASTFRVEIERSDYYNLDFDEDEWLSFRLTAPEASEALYGYAPRGPMGRQLLNALNNASYPEPARVTLSVTVADRIEDEPLLRIVSLINEQWLWPSQDLPLQPLPNHRLASRGTDDDF